MGLRGRLRHNGVVLPATAFPRDHGVRQGDVVENKRLAATLELIKAAQAQRVEERLARTKTTRRDARLLKAGTAKRTGAGDSP